MRNTKSLYHGRRFPPEIIIHAVWLYHRFCLSYRDVEDLLAERGIVVSYESIRQWCNQFGPNYAGKLKKRRGRMGDTWFLDEVFVTIGGKQQYLWRAVDPDGEIIDVFLQSRRNSAPAKRLFNRLLKANSGEPRRIVTDKLRSYGVAHRELVPDSIHDTSPYENNRAELSHQLTRVRKRGMRRFKPSWQVQRFLSTHAAVYNLFNLGRHMISASHYRLFRAGALLSWREVTAV
jgi:putative transposase